MTEYDSVMWCPKCQTRQVFNVSGSGREAICMNCEYTVSGTGNVQYLHHMAVLHHKNSRTLGDFIFEDLEKGLGGDCQELRGSSEEVIK